MKIFFMLASLIPMHPLYYSSDKKKKKKKAKSHCDRLWGK